MSAGLGARLWGIAARLGCMTVMAALAGCGEEEKAKRSEPPKAGSLRVANHGHFAIAVRVDREGGYGDLLVNNDGTAPVTLERVSWDRSPAAGISILGAVVAGPEREETIGFGFEFPIKEVADVAQPLEGYVVQPSTSADAVQVIIGVAAARPGRHRLRNIRVHYRAGDERRSVLAPGSLILCAPAGAECHAPEP